LKSWTFGEGPDRAADLLGIAEDPAEHDLPFQCAEAFRHAVTGDVGGGT
jgi:hypothetical protein